MFHHHILTYLSSKYNFCLIFYTSLLFDEKVKLKKKKEKKNQKKLEIMFPLLAFKCSIQVSYTSILWFLRFDLCELI